MEEEIQTPVASEKPPAKTTSVTVHTEPDTGNGLEVVTSTGQVLQGAEVIARTGPDPFMLASFLVIVFLMIGVFAWLIKRFQATQEGMINHYKEQSLQERERFSSELNSQREVHVQELSRMSDMFERNLDKIVTTNKQGMDSLSERLGVIDMRLMKVENYVTGDLTIPQRTVIHTQTQVVQEPMQEVSPDGV